jgi:RNA polymerase sigma-70 factor (ECF subfamily)
MPDPGTIRFDAQVAPHLATLLRVAYRLTRNVSDAEDLVQETCVAACENPQAFGGADHPVRWLLRVLHNRFIDRVRRQKRVQQVPLDDAEAVSPLVCARPGPEESMLYSDAQRAIARAFLKLEDIQRTLLVLRMEGYDLAEIEAITGIGREVLRARLHRARSSLARHLEQQYGVTSTALLFGSQS